MLLHISHGRSNWSSPSFFNAKFQNSVSLCRKANAEMVPQDSKLLLHASHVAPDLNFLDPYLIYIHALQPLPPGDSPFAVKYIIIMIIMKSLKVFLICFPKYPVFSTTQSCPKCSISLVPSLSLIQSAGEKTF
jgi:hypothetical protein